MLREALETTVEEHHTLIIERDLSYCNEAMERIMSAPNKTGHPVGLDIKIARIRAGLRQYQVAMSVGILPNRLSEIESGRRSPPPELLERIFEAVQGTADDQRKQESRV